MKKIIYFYWIFFVILIATIIYFFNTFSLEILKQLTPQIAILVLLFILSPIFLSIFNMKLIIKDMGYETSYSKLFYIIRSSMFVEHTAPLKISIPLRIYLYKKFQKIPITVGTAASTIELLLTLFVPAIISIFAIKAIFTEYNITIPIVAVLLILLVFFIIIFGFNVRLFKKPSYKFINKLEDIKERFQKSIKKLSIFTVITFTIITLLIFMFSAIRVGIILSIFDTPQLGIIKILYAYTLAFLIGGLSFIPAGLGVRDASLTFLLIQLSVPAEIAIATTLIERILTMAISIILGVYSITMLGLKHENV